MNKIKTYIIGHKIISSIVLIAILFGGYEVIHLFTSKKAATQYVTTTVVKGDVIKTVTGTGQVSASNQINLISNASGNVTSVNASVGQSLKKGDLIATVDDTNAYFALKNAQLALAKLTESADQVSLTQSQNTLQNAQASLSADYTNGLKTISDTFVDIPTILNSMSNLLDAPSGFLSDQNVSRSGTQTTKDDRNVAGVQYDIAKNKYTANLADYNNISATTPTSTIESVLSETLDSARALSDAVKDAKNTVDSIQNRNDTYVGDITTTQTNINSWLQKINTDVSNLTLIQNNIRNDKNSILSAQASLLKLQTGADPIDVQTQQLNVEQKQVAYNNDFIRAPFDGVLAALSIKKNDSISNSGNIGTFVTTQNIATISLNEVDAANIKVGQKATMTFDALPDLTISGTVGEIDQVGTVSQGVVSYSIQIAFDTQDARVKPGMSVSAAIITDMRQDVIIVPNSALKNQGATSYVQIIPNGSSSSTPPINQTVEVGLSDDASTEITSGLNEGDVIVTKTITAAKTTKSQTPSLLNSVTGGAGGGGAFRGTGGTTGR